MQNAGDMTVREIVVGIQRESADTWDMVDFGGRKGQTKFELAVRYIEWLARLGTKMLAISPNVETLIRSQNLNCARTGAINCQRPRLAPSTISFPRRSLHRNKKKKSLSS